MTSPGKLRVAIFHLGFFYSGGGEKLVVEEMRGLRALGHQVDCFAPFVDRKGCFPDMPEMKEIQALLPAPPAWLPMKDPLWVTLSCLLIPMLAWRFRSYDVLLGANQPGPWFAFVVGKLLRKPYVVYLAQALRVLHPRDVDRENGVRIREGDARYISFLTALAGRFIDYADRISVRNSAVVLTNGDHVGRWIRRVYGVENQACPAGCHPMPHQELGYPARWDGDVTINGSTIAKPFILLTNRHSPMKRFEYALWAMKSLRRKMPHLTLVITGQETEYTEQLRYLAGSLNIKQAVRFVGLVDESELETLYREAVVYVYPSPEEDFGMGIVEAMAAGTPVVAWANGGPTVTVRNRETGYLVTPYDTEEFAERLFQLLSSPELAERMGRAAHRRAAEYFSYDRHNRLLESALHSALNGRELGVVELNQIPLHSWSQEEAEVVVHER